MGAGIITNNVYRGVASVKKPRSGATGRWTPTSSTARPTSAMLLFPVNTARLFQAAYAVRDPSERHRLRPDRHATPTS